MRQRAKGSDLPGGSPGAQYQYDVAAKRPKRNTCAIVGSLIFGILVILLLVGDFGAVVPKHAVGDAARAPQSPIVVSHSDKPESSTARTQATSEPPQWRETVEVLLRSGGAEAASGRPPVAATEIIVVPICSDSGSSSSSSSSHSSSTVSAPCAASGRVVPPHQKTMRSFAALLSGGTGADAGSGNAGSSYKSTAIVFWCDRPVYIGNVEAQAMHMEASLQEKRLKDMGIDAKRMSGYKMSMFHDDKDALRVAAFRLNTTEAMLHAHFAPLFEAMGYETPVWLAAIKSGAVSLLYEANTVVGRGNAGCPDVDWSGTDAGQHLLAPQQLLLRWVRKYGARRRADQLNNGSGLHRDADQPAVLFLSAAALVPTPAAIRTMIHRVRSDTSDQLIVTPLVARRDPSSTSSLASVVVASGSLVAPGHYPRHSDESTYVVYQRMAGASVRDSRLQRDTEVHFPSGFATAVPLGLLVAFSSAPSVRSPVEKRAQSTAFRTHKSFGALPSEFHLETTLLWSLTIWARTRWSGSSENGVRVIALSDVTIEVSSSVATDPDEGAPLRASAVNNYIEALRHVARGHARIPLRRFAIHSKLECVTDTCLRNVVEAELRSLARRAYSPRLLLPSSDAEKSTTGHAQTEPLTIFWDTFCSCTGFNIEAINYLVPLETYAEVQAVADEKCFCRGYPSWMQDALERMRQPKIDPAVAEHRKVVWVAHKPPSSYPVFPYRGVMEWIPRPARVVGRSMIEFDGVPDDWHSAVFWSRVDEVWTPSTFVEDIFRRHLSEDLKAGAEKAGRRVGTPLRLLPEAVDTSLYDPTTVEPLPMADIVSEATHSPSSGKADRMDAAEINSMQDSFRFFANFKWEDRKGWEELLMAYLAEFSRSDAVVLIIKSYQMGSGHDPRSMQNTVAWFADRHFASRASAKTLPLVKVVSADTPAAAMPRLYTSMNCFVSPNRGEGWGLPMHEAMAMGLPTIATRYGGQVDFMTDSNSFLVDVAAVKPVGHTANLGTKNASWGIPSVEHLRKTMRYVFEHRGEANRRGQQARRDIVNKFSWKPVTKQLVELLGNVADDLRR